jgi:hypothetical protein
LSPLGRPRADLTEFPTYHLGPAQRLHRIHRPDRRPWWFSNDGSGRFDLEPPHGTCYVADDPLGSFVEVFRNVPVVAESDVAKRACSTLQVPERIALADCTQSRARSFGITAAIHSSGNYARTRRWAAAFANAGFGGVRYFVSHDPAQRLTGVALFAPGDERNWPVRATGPIDRKVVTEARSRFGILVLPAPA